MLFQIDVLSIMASGPSPLGHTVLCLWPYGLVFQSSLREVWLAEALVSKSLGSRKMNFKKNYKKKYNLVKIRPLTMRSSRVNAAILGKEFTSSFVLALMGDCD